MWDWGSSLTAAHRDILTGGRFYTDVKVERDKMHAGKFHLKARIRHQPVLPVLPALSAASDIFTQSFQHWCFYM